MTTKAHFWEFKCSMKSQTSVKLLQRVSNSHHCDCDPNNSVTNMSYKLLTVFPRLSKKAMKFDHSQGAKDPKTRHS